MAIKKDLLDQLLAGRDPKDVFNKDGLVDELKKALSERILNAEIDEHLEGEGGEAKGNQSRHILDSCHWQQSPPLHFRVGTRRNIANRKR